VAAYLTLALGDPLPEEGAPGDLVVVREGNAPVDDAVAGALLAALAEHGDVVAVSVRPVTDTLKIVTEHGVVVGTADREHHRFVGAPFALRLGRLRAVPRPATAVGTLSVLTALAEHARLVPCRPGPVVSGS
jgi:2-C-methyl-D-erythritol 4-phosphate cytidylyltransferase